LKFAILHHGPCTGDRHHYRIDAAGCTHLQHAESEPGARPGCIDIEFTGDADAAPPTQAQVAALRKLALQLKSRYPDIQFGGHRQIRGAATTCPGKHFPLTSIRDWADTELIRERDAALQELIDRQYRP
jgi:N-acetyl-anhydromuramyl-L-alanine amidase AmpD